MSYDSSAQHTCGGDDEEISTKKQKPSWFCSNCEQVFNMVKLQILLIFLWLYILITLCDISCVLFRVRHVFTYSLCWGPCVSWFFANPHGKKIFVCTSVSINPVHYAEIQSCLILSIQEQPPSPMLGRGPSTTLSYCLIGTLSCCPDRHDSGISRLGKASPGIPEGNVEPSFCSLFLMDAVWRNGLVVSLIMILDLSVDASNQIKRYRSLCESERGSFLFLKNKQN